MIIFEESFNILNSIETKCYKETKYNGLLSYVNSIREYMTNIENEAAKGTGPTYLVEALHSIEGFNSALRYILGYLNAYTYCSDFINEAPREIYTPLAECVRSFEYIGASSISVKFSMMQNCIVNFVRELGEINGGLKVTNNPLMQAANGGTNPTIVCDDSPFYGAEVTVKLIHNGDITGIFMKENSSYVWIKTEFGLLRISQLEIYAINWLAPIS